MTFACRVIIHPSRLKLLSLVMGDNDPLVVGLSRVLFLCKFPDRSRLSSRLSNRPRKIRVQRDQARARDAFLPRRCMHPPEEIAEQDKGSRNEHCLIGDIYYFARSLRTRQYANSRRGRGRRDDDTPLNDRHSSHSARYRRASGSVHVSVTAKYTRDVILCDDIRGDTYRGRPPGQSRPLCGTRLPTTWQGVANSGTPLVS
jgi:hypothetical protein